MGGAIRVPACLSRPIFRAFPGGGVGGNYTASPSNTALHRSWMLAERAGAAARIFADFGDILEFARS
jgi:hypothetical protein